jgi:hypothetical protein
VLLPQAANFGPLTDELASSKRPFNSEAEDCQSALAQAIEFFTEDKIGRHLTPFNQAMFVFSVISHRIVQGTDILPHQQVAPCPVMGKSIFGLNRMSEKKLRQPFTFLLGNIVDAHRISRIGVEYVASCDRMLQKYRMRYGRSLPALLLGQHWPRASLFTAHHFQIC